MDSKQEKIQKKSKNQTAKIVTIVLVALIALSAIGFLILNMMKPTTKDALTTAAKTSIKSADTTMVIKQESNKNKTEMVTTNYTFNKKTTHLISKLSPAKKNSTQEIWSNSKRVYNLIDNKWQYMDQSTSTKALFDEMFKGYNSLFTAHHFDRFSDKAFSEMKVKLDGLGGYKVTYDGNNKDVLEGLQKSSTVSGSNQKVDVSKIKKADITIKLDRKKQLRDLEYIVEYKENKSKISFHLTNVNAVNNLEIPADVKKNAKAIKMPDFNK